MTYTSIPAVSASDFEAIMAAFEARIVAKVGEAGGSAHEARAGAAAVRAVLRRLAEAVEIAKAGDLAQLCTTLTIAGTDADEVGHLERGYIQAITRQIAKAMPSHDA